MHMIKSLALLFFIFAGVGTFYYFKTLNSKLVVPSQNVTPQVLGLISSMGQIEQTPVEDSDKIVVKLGNLKVTMSKKKDIKSQVVALQELVKQLRMDTKNMEIDLRYNKAVLREY